MSYWTILAEASDLLDQDRFPDAESRFEEACYERDRSPGRVFFTEKVGDGFKRLVSGLRARGEDDDDTTRGRWAAAARDFEDAFRSRGDARASEAVRVAELLPEDDADGNLHILASGLYLMTRSRIFAEDLASAVGILKAALRVVPRVGRLFDVAFVRHDLPLTEEDRIWLAERGDALLATLAEEGGIEPDERRRWARALGGLLDGACFGSHSRFAEERSWLEARLCDRHLDDAESAVVLLKAFLERQDASVDRVAEARLRLLELLANVTGRHFRVPRYGEALRQVGAGAAGGGAEAANRQAAALGVIGWRRPQEPPNRAWASVGASADGELSFVFWWQDEPRDVARWSRSEDPSPLHDFLRPCQGRLVWLDAAVGDIVAGVLDDETGHSVLPHCECLLESQLPAGGLNEAALDKIALSSTAAWRSGWDGRRGPACLAPRRPGQESAPSRGAGLSTALDAGLVWLACRARVLAAPALLSGIRELTRRGDPVAASLEDFADLGVAVDLRVGCGEWTLPDLLDRDDPLAGLSMPAGGEESGAGPRPDLIGNRVAVVSSGRPGGVLAAWAAAAQRLRVVLDRPDRLGVLANAARSGLVTLVPPEGRVHCLDEGLEVIDELLLAAVDEAGRAEALLPLLHVSRLVETHNGDLLDYRVLRPRPEGALPLHDRYRGIVAGLRRSPVTEDSATDSWAIQYRVRARRSRLLVGDCADLTIDDAELDARWGVSRGGDAAWSFLDSAAVHWRLRRENGTDLARLHRELADRGRQHLSLVLGGTFLREELEGLLAEWLAPYGSPYCLALTDTRPPVLHLAAGGIAPDARVLALPAILSQWEYVDGLATAGEDVRVLLPEQGRPAESWRRWLGGDTPAAGIEADALWSEEGAGRGTATRLVVPVLASLATKDVDEAEERAAATSMRQWTELDRRRSESLRRQRRDCALEVNALLSCGVATVDIADARWWRRFAIGEVQRPTSGQTAAAIATENAGLAYDLPEAAWALGDGSDTALPPRTVETRDWMRRRGWVREDGFGSPPGWLRPPATWRPGDDPGPGVRLHLSDGRAAWFTTALWFCENMERGRRDCRLVVLGGETPAGCEAMLEAYPTAGASVIDGRAVDPEHCGLLVCLDPALVDEADIDDQLCRLRPQALFGGDLRHWFPGPSRPARSGARLLRCFARGEIPRIDVHASALETAWQDLLRSYWSAEGHTDFTIVTDAPTPGAGFSLPVLPPAAAETVCPGCGAEAVLDRLHRPCRECGIDVTLWQSTDADSLARRWLLRSKFRRLRAEAAETVAQPVRVYLTEADLAMAVETLRAPGLSFSEAGAELRLEAGDGTDWRVLPRHRLGLAPGDGTTALFFAPTREEAILLSRSTTPAVLCFGDGEVATCGLPAAGGAGAILALLDRIDDWLPRSADQALSAQACREDLLPLSLLGHLTGLPGKCVQDELHALGWVASLGGDHLPGAVDDGRRLLLKWPFAEIDFRLHRMADDLEALLPLLLSTTPAGMAVVCDLGTLPARIPAESLLWLDRFLLMSSLRLSPEVDCAPGDAGGTGGGDEILYRPVDGLLASKLRRVAYLGTVPGVVASLRHHLDLFLASVRLLLATAEATDDGYRVDLDVPTPGIDDEDVLELGSVLGLWRRQGPRTEESILLADLIALADAVGGDGADRFRRLSRGRADDAERWRRLVQPAPAAEALQWGHEEAEPEPRVEKLPKRLDRAAGRVAESVVLGGPALLVLRGCAGTGRHSALAAGLDRAVRAGVSPHAFVFYCPDASVAMRLRRHLCRVEGIAQPDIRVLGGESLPAAAGPGPALGADPAAEVSVLVEAQRLPTELRYRVAQHGRQGVQIVLVDRAETEEPWENLLLTTPRPADLLDFEDSLRHSRKVWKEVRELAGRPEAAKAVARRKAKGACRSLWAANLDECLAAVEAEAEAGRLGDGMLLVAPLPEDLAYLGRSLGARGWLPCYRQELDSLLVPGTLEFVAAVSDCAAEAGAYLAPLLPEDKRESWLTWREEQGDPGQETLGTLYNRICRTDWATPFLEKTADRGRVEQLVADFGGETAARFLDRPLWEAWRRQVCDLCGMPRGDCAARVVTLTTPERAPASLTHSGAYLCFGSEPRERHYRVLSRITDSLVVLYREHSPLPSHAAADRNG